MPYESLRDFLATLENKGELVHVKAQVSAELEIAEILRRVMTNGGPALLFDNVQGYNMPVAANLFGSENRMKLALEVDDFTKLGTRVTDLLSTPIPSGMLDRIKSLPRLAELTGYAPKMEKKGPVSEVIETANPKLNFLPALKSWPNDAGPFITFGMVVTKNPETGTRNLGVYRMQVYDEKTAGMHWQIHKRGALHYKMLAEKGRKIEAAVVIGSDPGTIYSSVAPVPEGLDKFLYAGMVRGRGVPLIKCNTVDLEVPSNAEIVLEGYVDPSDIRTEGPFGDHTGYYTEPAPYPTFHLTGVMRRSDPIYLATIVGKPVLEDAYIGKAVEKAFLPLMKFLQPEIVDVNFPSSGWFQGIAIVSIKKRYPGQAKKVMMGLWGTGQLSLTKILVVVDSDVNVHSLDDVIWAVTTRADPARDILLIPNVPTDTLDPASPLQDLGSKMGIDATLKGPEEGHTRRSLELILPDEKTKALVTNRWSEYGLPQYPES
ncbi:MAG: menaquinone biosynthesis decarboxylase [Nitrososphaerota archaeon]|nr:menaquinone biosynthesis decarboxylase [Nitrososphaerota archaeon]